MTPLKGVDLDQYKTQAKDLLKQFRAARPDALDRLRRHHPEHPAPSSTDGVRLADAQLVLARENGFPSWTKFRQHLLFLNAVRALDTGDLPTLEALLDGTPALLRYRCRVGEPYEEGYFAGATLLNHVAGNPARCPLPPNVLDVARLLIRRGVDPKDAQHTVGLLLTSRQASEAGVALPLIDLLMAAGAKADLNGLDVLGGPLGNEAYATAEALVRRGAPARLRDAAALGRLDWVRHLLGDDAGSDGDGLRALVPEDPDALKAETEEAFIQACYCGRTDVAEYLLEKGVDPGAGAGTAQPGLHYAAHMGHRETVERLIGRGVPLEVRNMYGGTALGQAVWSALNEPRRDHAEIIESLIAAGADVKAVGGRAVIDEAIRSLGANA